MRLGLGDRRLIGHEPRALFGEIGARKRGLEKGRTLSLVGARVDLGLPCEFVCDTPPLGIVQGQGPQVVLKALAVYMGI